MVTVNIDNKNENTDNKINEINNNERPWKIMLQNMEGLVTENSKEKVDFLKEYVKEDNIILINVTETWLNSTIKEDTEIEGYNIFRGDRQNRVRGGTAIYLHNKLEANLICEKSNGKCEMVAIMIPEIQTLNIVIYRPPGTESHDFNTILNEIQKIFLNLEKPDPTIILSGDLNFPFVEWKRMSDNSCTWEYKSNTNATRSDKEQFESLMNICNEQCMLQIIEEPTRLENTLDLIFTNEIKLVTMIEVNKSKLSDHNLIEISTNYTTKEQSEINQMTEDPNHILRALNFHTKSVKWENINRIIEDTNWEQNFENKGMIQSGKEFEVLITNSAIENAPRKSKQGNNRKIPKERKKLHNRIKMLKREKHRAYSKEKKEEI